MRKPTLSGRLFFFLSPRPAPAGPAEPVHNWLGTWPSIWLGKADPDKCDEASRAAQLKPSSEPLELIGDVRFVSEEAAALTNLTIRSAADLQTTRSGRFGKILVSNLSGAARLLPDGVYVEDFRRVLRRWGRRCQSSQGGLPRHAANLQHVHRQGARLREDGVGGQHRPTRGGFRN